MKRNVYISITSVLILSIRSNLFDTRPKRDANVWRGSMPRYYDIVITIVIVDFAINYTANNPFKLPFFSRLCCSLYIVTIPGYIECYRSYISTVLISRLKCYKIFYTLPPPPKHSVTFAYYICVFCGSIILNCNLIFLQSSLSCVQSNIATMGQSFSYR